MDSRAQAPESIHCRGDRDERVAALRFAASRAGERGSRSTPSLPVCTHLTFSYYYHSSPLLLLPPLLASAQKTSHMLIDFAEALQTDVYELGG